MAFYPVLKAAGLFTSPNPLASVPPGALSQADNVVLNFPDVVESRRGFEYVAYGFGLNSDVAGEVAFYAGQALVQYGTTLACDAGTSFVPYSGSFAPLDATVSRMKFAEAGGNLYFNTAAGVYGLDALTDAPFPAGAPPGGVLVAKNQLNGPWSTTPDAEGSWLNPNSQVGYCLVFGRQDKTKHTTLGTPSGRTVVSNPPDFTIPAASGSVGVKRDAIGAVVVTVALDATAGTKHRLQQGTQVRLTFDAADTDFTSGVKTVTLVVDAYTFTYDEAGTGGATNSHPVAATLGKRAVVLAFGLPASVDSTYFYRLYRTVSTLTLDVDAGNEFFLVEEGTFSSTDFTNGYATFTDVTGDAYLTNPLYSNAQTGETTDNPEDKNNNRPPLCMDMTLWQNRLWFANTIGRHTFTLTLLGVGAPNGLQPGDAVRIIQGNTFRTYTAGHSASPLIFNYADVDSTAYLYGQPTGMSAAEGIEWTAQQLCDAINRDISSPVNARYAASNTDVLRGQILLEERAIGGGPFKVQVSRASAWAPILPDLLTPPGKTATSDNNTLPHGLSYSKVDEYEAVGGLAYLEVGAKNKKILRIKALFDRLFVFKEDGIYTVTGNYPFRVTALDTTARLLACDTVQTLNNALYGLTTQGVVRVNNAGVAIVSGRNEEELKQYYGVALPNLQRYSFAVGYESYRKYILALPDFGDTTCTQQFVYDVATDTWTRWTKNITCAGVNPVTDYLYLGNALTNALSVERKNFDRTDYADESFTATISAATGTTVTLSSTAGIAAGDMLQQSVSAKALVAQVVDAQTLTMASTVTWALGSVQVLPGIPCSVAYVPNAAGQPVLQKHFREACFHFSTLGVTSSNATFSTELSPAAASVGLTQGGYSGLPWGQFNWQVPQAASLQNRRAPVPAQHARATYLEVGFTVREAQSLWSLCGHTLTYEVDSERGRGNG